MRSVAVGVANESQRVRKHQKIQLGAAAETIATGPATHDRGRLGDTNSLILHPRSICATRHSGSVARRGCTLQQGQYVHVAAPQWNRHFPSCTSTLFPQVAIAATTYAVIWWCVMTGTSVVLTAIGFRGASETLAMDHSRRKLLVVTLISPLMAPLCLFAFFCLPGDPTFAKGLTATSRIGYAWMGSLAILFSSFLTCAWPVCVRALIFYNSLRRNHHV